MLRGLRKSEIRKLSTQFSALITNLSLYPNSWNCYRDLV